MARRKSGSSWPLRLAAVALLAAIIAAAGGWWYLRHWMPPRGAWPRQGVEIGERDGTVDWTALKTIGADFAYLDASASAFARDPAFARNLEDARTAGVAVGAVHLYDPCQPADAQAANFVTVVPRDPAMLAPAVELDRTGDACPVKVSDEAVESELTTFLNQIEIHTGKAVILKLTKPFQQRYHLAHGIRRGLWLVGDRFQPDYADRPWVLWTANGQLATAADERAVRWVVQQR